MKTIYSMIISIFYLALGCLALTAFTQDFMAQSDLKPGAGVVFESQNNGLILLVSLPSTTTDLNSIELKITLINNTGADYTFREDAGSSLSGFHFDLTDTAGQKVEHTKSYKNEIFPGPPLGFKTITIKAGYAWVTTHSIKDHAIMTTPGQYTLNVDWRPYVMGQLGFGPDKIPKIAVSGTILISQLQDGSFTIVPVNN